METLKRLLGILFVGTIVFTSCGKKGCTNKDAANYCDKCKKDDGSCIYPGQVLFWTSSYNWASGGLTIYVENALVGKINQDYPSAPACQANGCVTYKNVPGIYNYKCIDMYSMTQKIGTITITSKGCDNVQIY